MNCSVIGIEREYQTMNSFVIEAFDIEVKTAMVYAEFIPKMKGWKSYRYYNSNDKYLVFKHDNSTFSIYDLKKELIEHSLVPMNEELYTDGDYVYC